jgi:hypothetical protein
MGRQIHFYMLPEDRIEFLRVVQEHGSITGVLRDSDSPQVGPTAEDVGDDKTLCLWNRKLLPNLKRKWIPDPGYYRLDTLKEPILEFTPSFTATWEGKPALGQGRLFGNFEPYLGKPEDFEKWYESLVHWIRQHYRKNTSKVGISSPTFCRLIRRNGSLKSGSSTASPRRRRVCARKQRNGPEISRVAENRAQTRSLSPSRQDQILRQQLYI